MRGPIRCMLRFVGAFAPRYRLAWTRSHLEGRVRALCSILSPAPAQEARREIKDKRGDAKPRSQPGSGVPAQPRVGAQSRPVDRSRFVLYERSCVELDVPVRREYAEYGRRVAEAVGLLADLEGVTMEDVLDDLMRTGARGGKLPSDTNHPDRRGARMNKIEIDANTDETGSIRIRLPAAPVHHPVHVVVEWDDAAGGAWPPGWFEATEGSIDDPTFVRQPQGTSETRDDLE